MDFIKKILPVMVMVLLGLIVWKRFLSMSSIDSATHFDLKFIEILHGTDATQPLPMLVILHGAGDTEKGFQRFASDLEMPVRVILMRGPVSYRQGYTWVKSGYDYSKLGEDLAAASIELTRRFKTMGQPILMGFSAGARVTYFVAARHNRRFSSYFPVAGDLHSQLIKDLPKIEESQPVIAFHGITDRVIPFSNAERTVNELQKLGLNVELRSYAIGHQLFGDARTELIENINQKLSELRN